MFRTCETYRFDLVSEGDTGPIRIPCRVEITSRRDLPDVDHHDIFTIDDTTDARLSMVTRSVITSRIAEDLDGMPIDGPILDLGPTNHAPERIAVWAYWLAHDQSGYERKVTDWNLVVESTRVIVSDRWSVEYAPTAGDR
jgi:hypothetical protein